MKQDQRCNRRSRWTLASVVTGAGMVIAHVDAVHAAPVLGNGTTTSDTSDTVDTTPTSDVGERTTTPTTQYPAPTSSSLASLPAAPEVAGEASSVGTGIAPVPGAIGGGVIVASGGPVPTSSTTGAASIGSLPTTGQQMEVPIISGVALALIGAALLRLRRRPSWD